MFEHLTQEHAEKRCTPCDSFLYCIKLQVGRCEAHVETCWARFKERFKINAPVQEHDVFVTATELDIMRRSGGAGLYAGAPAVTCDSNTHFATYRLAKKDRPGDAISCAALDHMFGALTSMLNHGRVANRSCCCVIDRGVGMREVRPVRLQKKPEPDDGLEEAPVTVDCHITESKIPGVDLCHDVNEPADTVPLAVRYLPEIEARLFWLNSQRNVVTAIEERINLPHVPMDLTDGEKEEIRALTEVLRQQIDEDKQLIDKIVQDKLGVYGWKSKKWTVKRAARALEQLRQTYAPKYAFEAGIKLEPSKRGKAPRLLVADGDKGQVMAWVLIGVLEAWLFKRYRHRSIKGLPKTEAMERVAQQLRQKDPRAPADSPDVPVAILENDGSAWDACMSDVLRDLVENSVMEKIAEVVEKYFLTEAPPDFTDARLASNKLVELRLGYRKGKGADDKEATCDIPRGKSWSTVIRAIRRSGCRGTSCLNFLANMVCWSWVIGGADAVKLIRPQGCKVHCVDGYVRFVKFCFEGDDSIVSFYCYIEERNMTEEFRTMMGARWVKLGHRPKLFWRRPGEVAEFTGWHFKVQAEGIDANNAAPDLFRNLTNMAFSINPVAINAAAAGDMRGLMRAVAPGIIARLYPLASRLPQFCRALYSQFGEFVSSETEYSRDEVYALELEPEDLGFHESDYTRDMDAVIERTTLRFQPVLERFHSELAKGDDIREPDLAVDLGLVKNRDDYYDLLESIEGGYRVGADSEAFRAAVAEIRDRPVDA